MGKFVEEIAEVLGKPVPSIRGKALALLRAGTIDSMPKQRTVKGDQPDAIEQLGDLTTLTVEDIAERIGKTPCGIKTMLTRRGLTASNYGGVARKEKSSAR